MEARLKDSLVRILLIFGSLYYLWGIIYIGQLSLKSPNEQEVKGPDGKVQVGADNKPLTKTAPPPEIPSDILGFVTGLGTILALHTGKLLGIPTNDEGNESGAEQSWLARLLNSTVWKRFIEIIKKVLDPFNLNNIPQISTILYFVGLVIGAAFYFADGRSPASAELLHASWTSLLGLILGIWSIKTS